MKSMTGYGKDSLFTENYNINVEIKSVNSRFLDLNIFIPREFSYAENELKNILAEKIIRGKVDLKIDILDKRIPRITINENKIKVYSDLLKQAAKITGFELDINLQTLIEEPDMVISENPDNVNLVNDIKTVLINALNQHQKMAIVEGKKMSDYIKISLSKMSDALEIIEKSFPKYKTELFNKLVLNIEKIIKEPIDEDDKHKILVETSLKIDKADITEEIVRLKSHIQKFDKLLGITNQPLGKKINFILQEMHREINTIGSKYNSNEIFENILFIKEEIEKCREIIQNVE